MNPIVSERFEIVQADGVRRTLVAEVGAPYVVDEVESRCPAKIDGLDPQYPDIAGATPLQALSLALRFLHSRLEHIILRGGRLTPIGEDEALDVDRLDVLFGQPSRGRRE